MSETLKSEVF